MAQFIRALDSKHLIIAGGYVKDASVDVEEVDLIGDISDHKQTHDAGPIALPHCTMLTARLMPGYLRDDSQGEHAMMMKLSRVLTCTHT